MKIIPYRVQKKIIAKDILSPVYFGYRSRFFKNFNDPTQYDFDFPDNTYTVNVIEAPQQDWNQELENIKTIMFRGEIYEIKSVLLIYEDAILASTVDSLLSHNPQNFILAILTVLINLKTGGRAIIAYKHCEILYNIIYILPSLFNIVRLTSKYIICENFINSKVVSALSNFIRYYINCPGPVQPLIYNNEEIRIKNIIKRL